ncbi:MAG: hypothetical protein GY810_20030 [Aureispira sp.]|nr:hypothetical protein [Aureispira sp.]
MKYLFLLFLAFALFSCGETAPAPEENNENTEITDENNPENTVTDANTTIEDHGEKIDVIALDDAIEELDRQIDASELPYYVAESPDPMVLEFTGHYIKESKEFKKLMIVYATGSGKRFYWLDNDVTVLEDGDLRYIFKKGEFKALDDGVSDVKTDIAEGMKTEVTKLMAQAQKILDEEIVMD